MESSIKEILHKYWGYSEFRPAQEQIISSVMAGRDTLALMPTGGGKSLTYQVPTMARKGVCIVVTPLIALMKDQVDRLRKLGISAVAIHSGMSYSKIDIALDNCVYGDVKFLYIAPERLATETFRLRVQRMNVSLLAVDEAHCISQWGYDFRPSYLRIAEVRKMLPEVPILALTASATDMVTKDIMKHLGFKEEHIIRSSFARPNLSYAVRHTDDKNEQLLRIVNNVTGSGIVYMQSREGCEQVATFLQENGISASYYHAGLPHAEREIRQEEWTSGKTRIVVATNAFGMGIDKADVRFVVHYTMSDSLESYYQEAGRAGRDGKRSYAVMLVASNDSSRISKHFSDEFPPLEQIKLIYEKVCDYVQVAVGDGLYASYIFNIHDFCRREHIHISRVRAALKLLQQNNYLTLTEEVDNPARIIFTTGRDDLYKIRVCQDELDNIIRVILRLYDGVFTEFRSIDEKQIAAISGYTIDKVRELLKRMWQMRIIRYIPANTTPILFFNEERLPTNDLYISPESYTHRLRLTQERFENVLRYIGNEQSCRSVMMQNYFGDTDTTVCGVCDICINKKKEINNKSNSLEDKVLTLIREQNLTSRELCRLIKHDPQEIASAVEKLKAEDKIYADRGGKLIIIE
ncbi:MAG: RecQ family ATP-dependent DNA helicase [Alistipes sp.]|jgi:ATP-dependent DNA helicase RecQ|nr:RecQ family ATP-dependent DNA helicase [Alistipes sp.]MBQ5623634.1 RecQ family ATP-dependent DNA helicase [Alistipes sp.]MBQ5784970.1 RecQ family ATP-dependent DNA helicase [Alistipes sp.]